MSKAYEIKFPVMLRKMWTGGEIQDWLDQLPALYTSPLANTPLLTSDWNHTLFNYHRLRNAIIAAMEPDGTVSVSKFEQSMVLSNPITSARPQATEAILKRQLEEFDKRNAELNATGIQLLEESHRKDAMILRLSELLRKGPKLLAQPTLQLEVDSTLDEASKLTTGG